MLCVLVAAPAFAKSVRVRGGVTQAGKLRMPHYRTSPNRSKADNYSSKGMANPYTGKRGTR